MARGFFNVPKAVNEPVKEYAPRISRASRSIGYLQGNVSQQYGCAHAY